MGQATAEAAQLRRAASSASARAAAARAQVLVADQQEENIEQLTGLLDEVEGLVENAIAKAARADTRGLDKAIAIIGVLLQQGVPSQAVAWLNAALEALQSHDGEVGEGLLSGLPINIPIGMP